VFWQLTAMAPIDLLMGGSPCQDFSIANQARQGLGGEFQHATFQMVHNQTGSQRAMSSQSDVHPPVTNCANNIFLSVIGHLQ